MFMFIFGVIFTLWYQQGLRFASLAFYKDPDERHRWLWMKEYLTPEGLNLWAIIVYTVLALLGPINAVWYVNLYPEAAEQ